MTSIPRPNLFLVDGFALIYRAFFAMISRPLTTSRGENTSAAWGVANFLLRIRETYQPDFLVWVNDAGTSFRTEVYPEYKATREKLDDELQDTFDRSVERIGELLEAFRVPLLTVEGYEADDVIGSLAARAAEAGLHAVIVSGDKDFYQLIGPNISLLNPGRGGPAAVQEEFVSVATAGERLGVPPHQVVDYLALVGDSSDNVPGVRGIGVKTAKKLLDDYGDLDSILQHAHEVSGKRAREALVQEAANAQLSRDLVTIRRDVDVDLDLDTFRVEDPDAGRIRQVFGELEFHSLVDRVEGAGGEPTSETTPFVTITTAEGVSDLMQRVGAPSAVGLAGLTSSSHPRNSRLLGLAVSLSDSDGWYLPLGHGGPALNLLGSDSENLPVLDHPDMRALRDFLEDPGIPKVVHDAKPVILGLRGLGVTLRGIVGDTMLASFLLDPGRRSHELAELLRDQLGRHLMDRNDLDGKGRSRRRLDDLSPDEVRDHVAGAAAGGLMLWNRLEPQLASTNLRALLDDVELPLISVLADMEWAGIRVDIDHLERLSNEFREEVRELEQAIYREAGTEFNIASTPQLRHVLFEKLQLPVVKKTKTGPSTDAEVLAQLAATGFEVPRLLLEYRELTKLISTYVDALPKAVFEGTGRIHTRFNQTGAATGRLSSSDPNLQNIPVRTERGERIRRCFVPAEGFRFIVADYSQVELRLLAHLSDDEAFIAAFQRGGDIHRETAAIIFDLAPDEVTADMRAQAKTINFATIYGQGPFALARQLEISQEEAKDFIAKYFERFAGVRRFLDQVVEKARERGYVETIFGRRRYIPELRDKNFNIRAFGERTAMNSPIQGSAADLIKVAMGNLHRRLAQEAEQARLLLQVHDELVLEVRPEDSERVAGVVREEMEGAVSLKVPVVVDLGVGENWLDAKH